MEWNNSDERTNDDDGHGKSAHSIDHAAEGERERGSLGDVAAAALSTYTIRASVPPPPPIRKKEGRHFPTQAAIAARSPHNSVLPRRLLREDDWMSYIHSRIKSDDNLGRANIPRKEANKRRCARAATERQRWLSLQYSGIPCPPARRPTPSRPRRDIPFKGKWKKFRPRRERSASKTES